MNDIIRGIGYFFSGLNLIKKPGLKRFVVVPVLINILIFIGLFFFLRHYIGEFNVWFAQHVPHWLQWLSWLIWLLFFLCFFIIFIFTFVTLGNVVAAPFNSFLAEKVELYLAGTLPAPRSLQENIRDLPRSIGRQFAILWFYLPRAIGLLILFFIPIIQAGAAFLWFLFNAWYMAFTYLDYPTDNHRVDVKTLRAWMHQNRSLVFGFGLATLVCSMLPVLNFFVIPAAVAGATHLWLDKNRGKTL